MSYLSVLCLLEILQNGTCSDNTRLQMIYTKAFQVLYVKVLQQFLLTCLIGKHPIIQLERKVFSTKVALKILFAITVVKHLFGRKVAQQFLYIIGSSLTCQKLTCRDIKKSHTKTRLTKMDSRQEVVLLVIQHVIAHGHTWCNQLGNATLNKLFCEFGVLQLVADGHTFASANQLRQIGIQGVMRKTSHFIAFATSTVTTMC